MTNNKPPLVLIPGLMCDDTVWTPLLPWLEEVSTPHLIDHAQANSLTTMAEQILDQHQGSFLMAGHSMGGRVALEFPHHVEGALADHGHAVINGKDDCDTVPIGGRNIGEVFDIPTHKIIIGLHQEHINFFLSHGCAHRTPAPFQFGGGDGGVDFFGLCVHHGGPH